jgi:rRNA maturation endonuclease Nob1
MLATVCKSCSTISRAIAIERCKYCGSKNVKAQNVNEELVTKHGKREILKELPRYLRN